MTAITGGYVIAELEQMSTGDLLALFATLETPRIAEMHGEYAARLLRQPSALATVAGRFSVGNPLMPWLCKAFRPVDADRGRGYNTSKLLGHVVQRFPMQTVIAPSRYDGQPAYTLVYRAYHSLCGDIHMVDEVRRLAPGVYLGIGTWGFTAAQRQIALPFLLEGPVENYRGDIGRERKGVVVAREIPALSR